MNKVMIAVLILFCLALVPSVHAVTPDDFNYRRVINITALTDNFTTPFAINLTFNHSDLVTNGKSQSDGDDIVIFYNASGTYTELDRVFITATNLDDTSVMFRAQANITISNYDEKYLLSYGNATFSTPKDNVTKVAILLTATDGMTMGYTINEGSGSNLNDIAGVTGDDMTLTGGFNWESGKGIIDDLGSLTLLGSNLRFEATDNSNSVISNEQKSWVTTGNYSQYIRFELKELKNFNAIWSRKGGATCNRDTFNLFVDSTGTLKGELQDGSTCAFQNRINSPSSTIAVDTEYSIVVHYEKGVDASMYIDGDLINQTTALGSSWNSGLDAVLYKIGIWDSGGSGFTFNGTFYEGAQYNRTVTQDEAIFLHYRRGLFQDEPNITLEQELSPDPFPPNISFIPPTPSDFAISGNSTQIINVSVTDNAGVTSCTLNWNGVNETMNLTVNGTGAICSTIKFGLLDSNYTYKAFAQDVGGNVNATEIRNLTIDLDAPIVTYIVPTPPSGSVLSVASNFTVNASVSNDVDIDVCTVQLDATNFTMIKTGTGKSVFCHYNFTNVTNGQHIYKVFGNNTVNKIGIGNSRTINFTVPFNTGVFNLTVSEDTWVMDDTIFGSPLLDIGYEQGNVLTGANQSYGNRTEILIFARDRNQAGTVNIKWDLSSFFKYNVLAVQDRVIEEVRMYWTASKTSCGAGLTNKTLWLQTNDSWSENTLTFDTQPTLPTNELTNKSMPTVETLINEPVVSTDLTRFGVSLDTANAELMEEFYIDEFVSIQSTFDIYNDGSPTSCGTARGNQITLWAREKLNNKQANLEFDLANSITGLNEITFGGALSIDKYDFDFESFKLTKDDPFVQRDFNYEAEINLLTPFNPAQVVKIEDTDQNTLLSVDCTVLQSYSFDPISLQDGMVICFNQSADHDGKAFYGAIKVKDASWNYLLFILTGGNLDFYSALYSPSFSVFSEPELFPDPPIAGIDLRINWTTSLDLTSYLLYFTNQTDGTLTPFRSILNESEFKQIHSVTVPGAFIVEGRLFFTLGGGDEIGQFFNSSAFNRSVGVDRLIINESAQFPQAIQGTVDTGLFADLETGIYVFGAMLLGFISLMAWHFGGNRFGIIVAVSGAVVFAVVGLLPQLILYPIVVLGVLLVIRLLMHTILGAGGG